MEAVKISDNVYWVGVFNPDMQVFDELYPTASGTTFNSYLVKGEDKTVLIDTVEDHFFPEFLKRLQSVCPVEDIDIIVSNHTEHDHSGSIDMLLQLNPDIEVYSTRAAEKFLQEQLNHNIKSHAIKDGEELSIGGQTLRFIVAPFLHWPDTMFTYLEQQQILFSCDAFGAHHCPKENQIFADLLSTDLVADFKFYFDTIIRPFKANVRSALEKIAHVSVKIICPSHGPIYRQDIDKLVKEYQRFSSLPDTGDAKRVLMLEHSPHGTVRAMGDRVAELLLQSGCTVVRMAAIDLDEEQFMQELEVSDALIVGAATINRDAGPPVWQALRLLSAVAPKNKLAAVYGAYGWSGEAVQLIEQRLQGVQYKLAAPGVRWQFSPTEQDIAKCLQLAAAVADAVNKVA